MILKIRIRRNVSFLFFFIILYFYQFQRGLIYSLQFDELLQMLLLQIY